MSFFALLPPYFPHNDPKDQNFQKKIKQMPGDIILPYIHWYHT